jgi:arsenic resistance protein ArsH
VADTFPALDQELLPQIDVNALKSQGDPGHKPRILLLYGSVREQS